MRSNLAVHTLGIYAELLGIGQQENAESRRTG